MKPLFINMKEKKFVGSEIDVSLSNYHVGALWKKCIPIFRELKNKVSEDLYSISIYPADFFTAFNPEKIFQKRACTEVRDFSTIPEGLFPYKIPGGLYAVFLHKGDQDAFAQTSRYIYEIWLPKSGYTLDHRPHFEILGENYRNNDPDSEEEIWIPVSPQ